MCLAQIDVLSGPKHSPLPSLRIARYSPKPQSHIERIDAALGPKRKLTDPVLFGMAGGTQRNGVPITRFHSRATVSSGAHMRGFRRGFTAGDARELADKSEVLLPSAQMRLGFWARYGAGDAGCGHRSQELTARVSGCAFTIPELVNIGLGGHRPVSRLASSAAFNANLPCGAGIP